MEKNNCPDLSRCDGTGKGNNNYSYPNNIGFDHDNITTLKIRQQ